MHTYRDARERTEGIAKTPGRTALLAERLSRPGGLLQLHEGLVPVAGLGPVLVGVQVGADLGEREAVLLGR
ncbi:hypothetical protein, partial [Streptomyces sp. NPDC059452]|uniref:hypothetical protein n=1 Tax=Streptomyces sp. NPDC059452 TaxID=3346835 RepID=UPI0036984515